MRILTLIGEYGYRKGETFSGFVCFCHVDKEETKEKIITIASKLASFSNASDIILVPFAHLYEGVAEPKSAQNILNQLASDLRAMGKKVIGIPFGVVKELHLDVLADNSAIRFLNF
ncbi:MAG TPA: threonyl-tRNA synthetase editing domain-containing protein [bacterium]|nr:threonyl-tRNA synthetase editing domain-containing protein [bacterium]